MSIEDYDLWASTPGEPYNIGITAPDSRFKADLAAVDEYVRITARGRLSAFPNSLAQIQAYEQWRQGIPWYDMNFLPNDVMATAKSKLAAINAAQKSVLPEDTHVEPGAFLTTPIDPETQTSRLTQFAIAIGVSLAGVLLIAFGASKLNPVSIATRVARRS